MTGRLFSLVLTLPVLAWTACAPADAPEAVEVEPPAIEKEEVAVTGPLAEYLAAQEALAADDLGAARAAFERLAFEAPEAVASAAREAAAAEDLEAVRRHFVEVTQAAIEHLELPEGVVLAHCPMAHEDGASWLQLGEEIRNPYYGRGMLTCGEVVEREG